MPGLNKCPLNMMTTNMNKLVMVADEAGMWSFSLTWTPHIEPGPRGWRRLGPDNTFNSMESVLAIWDVYYIY